MADCDPSPIFVDCDGNTIAVTVDALGNDVYRVCVASELAVYDWDSSATLEPVGPFIEGFYNDTNEGCISHMFVGGVLRELCADG